MNNMMYEVIYPYEGQYLELLKNIQHTGIYSKNRTGINTYKLWGAQIRISLANGFPLLTTKKMHWKSVVHELLWMIQGDTNIQYLLKNGVTFWTEWPFTQYQQVKPKLGGSTIVDPILLTNQEQEFVSGKSFGVDIDNNLKKSISEKMKLFEQEIINNDEFAKKWGSIGEHGYGGMWRKFPYYDFYTECQSLYGHKIVAELGIVDQLTNALNDLKYNPDSRRIIITAWHPYHSNNKNDALLPACHNYIQFGTEEMTNLERTELYYNTLSDDMGYTNGSISDDELNKKKIPKYRLNCYFNMRSNDVPLGLPYNIAFYALLTHLVAHCVNMIPNLLVYTGADVHIYENQLDGIKEQLTRPVGKLPKIKLSTNCPKDLFAIAYNDIDIIDYNPLPNIKIPVAI